jgi:hypothetical protein
LAESWSFRPKVRPKSGNIFTCGKHNLAVNCED